MNGLDHTTAQWADGPLLMRWLDAQVKVRPTSPTVRRRLERWRSGQQARFEHIDELLCSVAHATGIHLGVHDIPVEVWRPYDNGRRRARQPQRAMA